MTSEGPCRDGAAGRVAHASRDVARTLRRAVNVTNESLGVVAHVRCEGLADLPSCRAALAAVEAAVAEADALTTALRALWSELSGCAEGCACSKVAETANGGKP